MKKIISLLLLFSLIGCHSEQKSKLYIFVSQTCGECLKLKENFLPKIEDEQVEIVLLDVDLQENVEIYNEVLDRLENIDRSLYNQKITPFIYLENKFGALGYHEVMDEAYLQLIHDAMNNNEYAFIPSGVYLEKEDK